MTDDEIVSWLLDADEHAGGGTRYQDAADAITKLRQERDAARAEADALRALLKEMRDASFIAWQLSREGRDYIARIDAALGIGPARGE